MALVASPPGQAFESDFSNLPRTGGATIESGASDIVLEVFGQFTGGIGIANIEATASSSVTGEFPLTVTEVSEAVTPSGRVEYFTLDASPLCSNPGEGFIVTAKVVVAGVTFAVNSKLVVCQ